jgi:hypothetical protein
MSEDEKPVAAAKLEEAAQIARDRLTREAEEAAARVTADSQREPTGRVTNRDLWLLSAALNDRISTVERGQNAMLEHVDAGFEDLRANMLDLRGVVNDQLHKQDSVIEKVAQAVADLAKVVAQMRRGFDVKNALLKGSWKLTFGLLTLVSIISGAVAHYGLYTQFWHWCH